jgi:16S rRNA (uracil1498-N3)-methyltransferase
MHLFYAPDLVKDDFLLPEEESRHCSKVLRLKEGDLLALVDGKGTLYSGHLSKIESKRCKVFITGEDKEFGRRPYSIHIAMAPTKNLDRTEWFVEKATEVGIQEISFIQCHRSERKQINPERLKKIAISAMKQSKKAYLPIINEITPFSAFLDTTRAEKTFIAHLEEHNQQSLREVFIKNDAYCVLIGPEGDFTPGEINLAYAKGIKPVTLGPSRLRTETAALVACHILHVLNEVLT